MRMFSEWKKLKQGLMLNKRIARPEKENARQLSRCETMLEQALSGSELGDVRFVMMSRLDFVVSVVFLCE
jgi:hypothetical protein